IVDHVFDEIAELEIALIAERDAGTEADAVAVRAVEHRNHQCAALAHEPDVTDEKPLRIEDHRRAEREMKGRIEEAHAVRPDNAHTGLAADARALLLPRGALDARLGKTRGHDHAATDTSLGALGDAADQLRRRHREDRYIDFVGRLADRGMGRMTEDLAPTRI